MEKYKNLHLWMIIPMVIMQLGIALDYWGDFSENVWPIHVHYWTGTVWYLFLITQPYYATHGKMERHRTNGIIGFFLAGGVAFAALAILDRDLKIMQLAIEFPERFMPFTPEFFIGVPAVEIIMILSFIFAVCMAIIHRKELENHAWWLISTVFLIMMPALSRGLLAVHFIFFAEKRSDVNINVAIISSQVIIILLVVLGAAKFKKLKHPATFLAIAVNIYVAFVVPIGNSPAVQKVIKWLIRTDV